MNRLRGRSVQVAEDRKAARGSEAQKEEVQADTEWQAQGAEWEPESGEQTRPDPHAGRAFCALTRSR